jgi:hypothetical protein
VARISTGGAIDELGTPDPDSSPQYVTLGPDGAMWFTESNTNRLGRVARDGRITKFDLPDPDSGPTGIVGRSDGRLYYGLINIAQIGFIDLAAAQPTPTATPTSIGGATATPTPVGFCAGDCDGNEAVSIAELIASVNIALGTAPLATCEAADYDVDGMVSVSELIRAVNSALIGCPVL